MVNGSQSAGFSPKKIAWPGFGPGGVIGGRLAMGCGSPCLVMPSSATGLIARLPGAYPTGPGTTSTGPLWSIGAVRSAGVLAAAQIRFSHDVARTDLALSLALPLLWLAALWMAGAYDVRFIGIGSDEFRRVLNAGVSLTAAVAIFSYAVNLQLSRGYVVIALPSITMLDLFARYWMRKRLHRQRAAGKVRAQRDRCRP